ncbi:hypothetical protein, partial [Halomonas sp. 707D4]|uniref:hypothetical protein n=1 Tax=Halomonas sp. 707D4 TaxID=1904455 RepID=UPI00209DE032
MKRPTSPPEPSRRQGAVSRRRASAAPDRRAPAPKPKPKQRAAGPGVGSRALSSVSQRAAGSTRAMAMASMVSRLPSGWR